MSYTHDADRPAIVNLLAALSDTPLTHETYAWLIGRTANVAILELRLAALLPDAQPITRTAGLAAWASRRLSATIVYWLADGELEITLDDDLEAAISTIRDDIAPAGSSAPPTGDARTSGRPTSPTGATVTP